MDIVATRLEGAALSWVNTELTRIQRRQRAPFHSWEDFCAVFTRMCEPTIDQELARQQMKALRHTGRVAGYLQRFRELRYRLPTMSTDEAYAAFIDGLNPALRAQIGALTSDLEQVMLLAERMGLFQANASTSGAGTATASGATGGGHRQGRQRGGRGQQQGNREQASGSGSRQTSVNQVEASAVTTQSGSQQGQQGQSRKKNRGRGRGRGRGDQTSREVKCFACGEAHYVVNCPIWAEMKKRKQGN